MATTVKPATVTLKPLVQSEGTGGTGLLLRLRVSLPDRPGSLGKIARVLGVLGADIVQVVVLAQEGGRALDDFSVRWPDGAPVERIRSALSHVRGVQVS